MTRQGETTGFVPPAALDGRAREVLDAEYAKIGYRVGNHHATKQINDATVRAMLAFAASPEQPASEAVALRAEIINSPETADFMAGVPLEAAHQRERWGSSHDAGKEPEDWVFLVGWLLGKASVAARAGDLEKAKHHTISSAAALANWHAALSGADTTMRPGIDPAERNVA